MQLFEPKSSLSGAGLLKPKGSGFRAGCYGLTVHSLPNPKDETPDPPYMAVALNPTNPKPEILLDFTLYKPEAPKRKS